MTSSKLPRLQLHVPPALMHASCDRVSGVPLTGVPHLWSGPSRHAPLLRSKSSPAMQGIVLHPTVDWGRTLIRTNQTPVSFAVEPTFSSEMSDEELIAGLVAGHIAALDALYTRYSKPVFSLAFRIVNDSSDAEEITQDVFERLWRSIRSFDSSRGRFGTWLLSMTHHIAIDMVRRHQRRPQTVYVDDAEPVILQRSVTRSDDVSEMTIQNMEAEQVRRMLRSLPVEQRQVIELAYFGGLSHLEIAARLGDPLGTVKTRIRRGMERLRTALEGTGLGKEQGT